MAKKNNKLFARWAVKTALVLNDCTNYRKIIEEDHYKDIYEGRIPKNVSVFIAFSADDNPIEFVQSQNFLILGNTSMFDFDKRKFYNIIFKIKHIIVMVFGIDAKLNSVSTYVENSISIYPEFGITPEFSVNENSLDTILPKVHIFE